MLTGRNCQHAYHFNTKELQKKYQLSLQSSHITFQMLLTSKVTLQHDSSQSQRLSFLNMSASKNLEISERSISGLLSNGLFSKEKGLQSMVLLCTGAG